jgi:hypothetical protein
MRSDLSRQISFLDSSRRCNHEIPVARLEPNTQTRLDVKTRRKKKMSGGNRVCNGKEGLATWGPTGTHGQHNPCS